MTPAMPRSRTQLREVLAELVDEHRQLTALLQRLAEHRSIVGLVPLLEELHTMLITHFAHEQFPGGLYECLGVRSPSRHETLRALVREHCVLLSTARGLLERARTAAPADEGALLDDVAALVEQLREHEEKEYRLAASQVDGRA